MTIAGKSLREVARRIIEHHGEGALDFAEGMAILTRENPELAHWWDSVADAISAILDPKPSEGERIH